MLEQDPSSGQRSEVTWISPQSFNGERYFWEMLRYSRFINHFNIFIWYFPFLFTGWRFSWRMEHQKKIWANREIVYQRNNFSSFLRPTNYLKKPAYSIKAVSLFTPTKLWERVSIHQRHDFYPLSELSYFNFIIGQRPYQARVFLKRKGMSYLIYCCWLVCWYSGTIFPYQNESVSVWMPP